MIKTALIVFVRGTPSVVTSYSMPVALLSPTEKLVEAFVPAVDPYRPVEMESVTRALKTVSPVKRIVVPVRPVGMESVMAQKPVVHVPQTVVLVLQETTAALPLSTEQLDVMTPAVRTVFVTLTPSAVRSAMIPSALP